MRPAEIQVGDRLLLTKEAKARYGFTDPVATVCNIYTRPGYKVPWVLCVHPEIAEENGEGAFRPSDFAHRVTTTAAEANAAIVTRHKKYS